MRATTFQSISQCTMGLLRHRRAQESASLPIQQKTHFTETSPRTTLRRVKRSQRMRRIPNASSRPSAAPAMSATQSLISALRPNWGWMSSIAPPNATAPIKSPTKSRPRGTRRDKAAGNTSSPKAARCTSLSVPLGTDCGTSTGVSIATARPAAKRAVIMRRGERKYMSATYGLACSCASLGCGSRWRNCL